ncbi:HupE/UreJ family protein [Gorillibacterium sp. sgz5001074]|uniref:HupE/UreJ family protein n=1 Tax=Gorillibacterium sp. sgz5001074 TaxID=3446695 RepID=UPI003F662631
MFRRILSAAAAAAILLVLLWTAAASRTAAHPFNNGYSDLRIEGAEVYYGLFLPAAGLPFLDSDRDGKITDAELRDGRPVLEDYVSERLALDNGDFPMDMRVSGVRSSEKEGVPGVAMDLLFQSEETVVSLHIQYNLLFDDIDPVHLNFVTIRSGGVLDQYLFEDSDREYLFDNPASLWSRVAVYFRLGVVHIFSGQDHLAFLLSLLLAVSRWKEALAVVTAFTASHSLTLLLAASGYLPVSPRLVEAGIALSICYVAAGNPFVRRPGRRWIPALLLGLIHGLGFAGALGETGLPATDILPSLIAFNLGVELGQVVLVAATLPLLLWLRQRYVRPYRILVWAGSAGLFVLGLHWFVQRIG